MKYLIRMSKYLIIALLLFSCFGNAQKITVLDGDGKEQISNVAVFNKDKSKIALTDFDGVFNASVFGYKERITLKHVGYQEFNTTKQQLQRQGNKVYLVMKAQELDEVVMSVSKWEQQKRDIPNKIISLDARTITFTTPQTSADLLQNSGKVFVQKSQLGGGSPMIRGFATNRLLLSVDGVRMQPFKSFGPLVTFALMHKINAAKAKMFALKVITGGESKTCPSSKFREIILSGAGGETLSNRQIRNEKMQKLFFCADRYLKGKSVSKVSRLETIKGE